MTILHVMTTISVMMFCAQIAFNMIVEEMRWYWAVYSAVILYSAVVVLLAVLANVDTIFPQMLLRI